MRDGRLFEWTGVDQYGDARDYQTLAPDCVTESGAIEHLQAHYPHLKVTAIKEVYEPKPATGIVQSHTYRHGIVDEVMREIGKPLAKPVRPVVSPFEIYKEGMRRRLLRPISIQSVVIPINHRLIPR